MLDFYNVDQSGKIISQKSEFKPFSAENIKRCPQCRGSLRSIRRYTSLIKRGLIDEATKKFIVWSNRSILPLEERLHQEELKFRANEETAVQARLMLVDVAETRPQANESSVAAKKLIVRIESATDRKLLRILSRSGLQPTFKAIKLLHDDITQYLCRVTESEQPFGRIRELVEQHARRQARESSSTRIVNSESKHILQSRYRLLATALKLRCSLVILGNFYKLYEAHVTNSSANAKLFLDTAALREECTALILEAHTRSQPLHEVEGLVYFARFTALERSTPSGEEDQTKTENFFSEALVGLDAATDICNTTPSVRASGMESEIETARVALLEGVFYQEVGNDERREVYQAMAREFSGTGHWYYCENGHPFTIGECGMPMESARCPQCGATIGGEEDEVAQGVTSANDLDSEFGGSLL